MKAMIEWAVRNSPAMNTLMIAILVVGIGGAALLKRESFPEFTLERVIISVPYPGASPAEVEEGICQKIEEAIRSVDGIRKVLSVSSEGVGVVTATLHTHVKDTARVVNDIRSEVDRIPSFPELAEEPEVRALVIRQPAIQVGVAGPDIQDEAAEWQLRGVAEEVYNELLKLPSISQVTMMGTRPYQIDVEISESTLRKYGLSLRNVADIIGRENVEIPAGRLKTNTTEFLLRGSDRQLHGEQIAQIPIVTDSSGVVLTVGDLGEVVDGFEDTESYSYINGRPAISMQVDKTMEEDLLQIVREVREYVDRKALPPGFELVPWFDQSIEVRGRLNLLTRGGTFGLILVFLTLSLFLNIRLAFWVSLGIPVSLLGTCAVMLQQGQTLNMLTMFSFVMALGIVVDDAIVVGENIFSHRQRGKGRIAAAIDGTVEVAPAVTASVMTTVIAFLPMLFVAGVMGKFIAVMPLAIISILVLSLFESIFILPCHLGHTNIRKSHGLYDKLRQRVDGVIQFLIHRIYAVQLRWVLEHPGITFATSAAVLLVTAGLVVGGFTPFVLAPQVDGDFIVCNMSFPAGTSAATTDAATAQVEQSMREVADEFEAAGTPVLKMMFRAIGTGFQGNPMGQQDTGANYGFMFVELLPAPERPQVTMQEVITRWRERSGEFPGAERVAFEGTQIGPGGRPIEFKLVGEDVSQLEEAVEKTKQELASFPGVYDIADGDELGKWEVQLKVHPRAESMGVKLADLATVVRGSYYGEEVMRLQRGRHEVKLMVRYPEEERRSLAQLDEIRVRTPQGNEIPLPELAQRDLTRAASQIVRVDQQRTITITANIDEDRANAREIVESLRASFLPILFKEHPGIGVRWEGQQEETQESVSSLLRGFIVAMFAIFLLLTIQFRSYLQPLIILAVIPFGMVGAVAGHLALQMPLTLFTLFGVVALSGVVVNDSIVLIDFINRLRRDGRPLNDVLVDAGCQRFRPVSLTTITTIAGLLPILVERSVQAAMLIPMAVALAAGLAVATLWILLLVPLMYSVYARYFSGPDADVDVSLVQEKQAAMTAGEIA